MPPDVTPLPAESLFALLRQAHADHRPRAIRLEDGTELRGLVTAVVGSRAPGARVKVVLEAPPRERRWLPLRAIATVADAAGPTPAHGGGESGEGAPPRAPR